ncbi:MAG: AAA family ATPase, partial [Planctomycetota bacterium]|nr:AAA family ATPase [Planctomycetota bacterium]
MRIHSIDIDQFGVWENLSLALQADGMNVLYGPNEAGKSTLLRLIRGVLFGYDAPRLARGNRSRQFVSSSVDEGGRLTVSQDGEQWEIARTIGATLPRVQSGRGTVAFDQEELGAYLMSGTSREVFDNVFAFGLHELQRLATLEDDQIAEHIYNLSLGPEARRLLDASDSAIQESGSVFDPVAETGDLAALFERRNHITTQMESLGDLRKRHEELTTRREKLESAISDLKRRQSGIHSEVRGHQFMAAVYEPWKTVTELEAERDRIPAVVGFEADCVQQLDELEAEIKSATRCRDSVIAERIETRKQLKRKTINANIQRHGRTMRFFIDQREWLTETSDKIERLELERDRLDAALQAACQELGPDWTVESIRGVDTSPSARLHLVRASNTYQNAIARRSRLRRKIKRMESSVRRHEDELNEQLVDLGIESPDEIEDAIVETQSSFELLGQNAERTARAATLKQQIEEAQARLANGKERNEWPAWLDRVLAGFGIVGTLLAVSGAIAGVTVSILAGLVFGMLGATWFGLGRALRAHFEQFDTGEADRLARQIQAWEVEVTESFSTVVGQESVGLLPLDVADNSAESSYIASCESQFEGVAERLVELETLLHRRDGIRRRKRRLSDLRGNRRPTVQNDYRAAKNQWCEVQRELGLTESEKIAEPLSLWERISHVNQAATELEHQQRELDHERSGWQTMSRRIEQLARTLYKDKRNYSDPQTVLPVWEHALQELKATRSARRQLKREARDRRQEAAGYSKQIDELKQQRQALLSRVGAGSREEFDQRVEWDNKRRELEELLRLAQEELATFAAAEPELAIVEEDLHQFDPEVTATCIATLQQELDELKRDVERSYEQLGSLKQQQSELESSKRQTELQFEHEQLTSSIRNATTKWFGVKLAGQTIDLIRDRFERANQPPTLAAASDYLGRLTQGRYCSVWTPLTEQRLFVTDSDNRTFSVDQLSQGTREQLFLAIRFALVQRFAKDGLQLPLVLDDVFVNFDQARTEAAVETLMEVAKQGQQVLFFTCHLHLAQ